MPVRSRDGRIIETWGDIPRKRFPGQALLPPTGLASGMQTDKGIVCAVTVLPRNISTIDVYIPCCGVRTAECVHAGTVTQCVSTLLQNGFSAHRARGRASNLAVLINPPASCAWLSVFCTLACALVICFVSATITLTASKPAFLNPPPFPYGLVQVCLAPMLLRRASLLRCGATTCWPTGLRHRTQTSSGSTCRHATTTSFSKTWATSSTGESQNMQRLPAPLLSFLFSPGFFPS